jgi:peptide/nickel transport system substrate-binding protein
MSEYIGYWQRRISRRRALAAGTALAGASLPLVGVACGSSSSKDSTPTAPAGTSSAAASPSASNGTAKPSTASANVGIGLQFGTNFNPFQTGQVQGYYFAQVFNSLFEWGFDSKAQPSLAQSVEAAPDGLSMTFKLRPNVEFHHGGTLTSEDVAFSFELATQATSKLSQSDFKAIDSVTTPDPQTVVVKLKQVDATFAADAYGAALLVVPKAYWTSAGGADGFGAKPSGTGAYQVDQYTPGNDVTFTRFDKYFRGPAPFAKATFKSIADPASLINALQAGQVDFITPIEFGSVDQVKGFSSTQVLMYPVYVDIFYKMGITLPSRLQPTEFNTLAAKDVRFRQAMNWAINKEGIAKTVYGGDAVPFTVTSPKQPFAIDPSKAYTYDAKKAKDLMSAAGVPDGLTVEIHSPVPGSIAGSDQLNAVVQSNLKDLGLNVKIVNLSFQQFNQGNMSTVGSNPGMDFSYAGPASLNSPFQGIDFNYASNHGSIYTWWSDSKFDAMADKARATLDTQERNAQLKAAFEYAADQAPMVWTVLIPTPVAFREKAIKSIKQRPGGSLVRIEDWQPA